MKIYLNEAVTIEGKTFPACAVIDVYQPEGEALIASGKGKEMPDGTMARIKSYDAPGCFPQQSKQTTNTKK